ncbi:thiamine pyrophosphokinase 1-like isoform X3 [Clytia hemisphaerica]|uniref:thiamine pyrophosphokinase 1-like isoform X3 n=1 Tax=Clytia hemisphaerica TaxID=252671 RepID=UPI0034D675D3
MSCSNHDIIFDPFDLLRNGENGIQQKILLLVLNLPFTVNSTFTTLWKKSCTKFCCDGGSNRLFDASKDSENFIPDFICGDLDSLKETTKTYYLQKNVKLEFLYDQDNTDFTKTAMFALEECHQKGIEGKTRIKVERELKGGWCSLIPIACKAEKVTTTGFKWNLDGDSMEFGSLVSTSNAFGENVDHVTVDTSHPLLITFGIKS